MGFCKLTSKTLVGLAGIVFFIISAFLLVISISVMTSYGHLGEDIFKHFYTLFPVVVLLVASIFFGLAGIVACCAMFNHNKCLLTLLGGVLVLIIATLCLGIVGLEKSKPVVDSLLHNATVNATMQYGNPNATDVTSNVDFVQAELHCCGVDGPADWQKTPFYEETQKYPRSCCNGMNGQCNGTEPFGDASLAWKLGCYDMVRDELKKNAKYITIGTGVVLAVLVLMLMATCALCFIKRRHQDLPYSSLAE